LPSEPREIVVEIPAAMAGVRIDKALRDLSPGVSRTRLKDLIERGFVTVGGKKVSRPGVPVAAGERVRIVFASAAHVATAGSAAPIRILYEDRDLAVIFKPSGVATHPNENCPPGSTVSDAAVARYGPDLPATQGEDRPGIVHRLDRETSGVMVIARTYGAMASLRAQFKARSISKEYRTIARGEPRFDSDRIEAPIGRDTVTGGRMTVAREGGRPSETFYEVLERFPGFAYLRCLPKTGRTHQIRVHLAHLGLPIVGDRVYRTRAAAGAPIPPDAPPHARQFLHAFALSFDHPSSGERVHFEVEIPEDMRAFLAWLRARR
jgi:23S rRNA pseudouridine1911/1915/1917 synthase